MENDAEARQVQIGTVTWTARIMVLLAFGSLASGCKEPSTESKATVAAQREKAITATKKADHGVQNYAYAQKGEFIDAAKRELADLQRDMERLRQGVDRSTGAARADAEAKLKVLTDKLATAKTQLDRAEAANEASWEDVQSHYQASRDDLTDSFDETRRWLSKRISP